MATAVEEVRFMETLEIAAPLFDDLVPGSVSLKGVEEMLGVPQQKIYALVRAGLLPQADSRFKRIAYWKIDTIEPFLDKLL